MLQEPAQALSALPRDSAGNQVDWMRALNEGKIAPRAKLNADAPVRLREDDILLNLRGGLPIVRFPHRSHTQWLDCSNCHEHIFKSKVGANRLQHVRDPAGRAVRRVPRRGVVSPHRVRALPQHAREKRTREEPRRMRVKRSPRRSPRRRRRAPSTPTC